MHTKVIVCGGIKAGKETALRIAQVLHENGLDAEVIEELDVPPVIAARVKDILAGCGSPEMVGNRPPPTLNPSRPVDLSRKALEESVSHLLKKVGKLQAELMDKVGSKNVIIDNVKSLKEIEYLKEQLAYKSQQLGVLEEEKQNLVSERDEANGHRDRLESLYTRLKDSADSLVAENRSLMEDRSGLASDVKLWRDRAFVAERALKELGITNQGADPQRRDEDNIHVHLNEIQRRMNMIESFTHEFADVRKRVNDIGGRVEDIELRLSEK